ncbi:MAG: extracellular solute-binding protein [Lachnospiraceae bacterium]|nr:extracellular solute-binding protein [Lachnospiraceae bacterium]MBR4145586.1 extracellular solute-binding protein [Lachnospiraceae bacterium]MBR4781803.1 extracellular solute-binding protein [Lachnospiraceae bacterium]MBR6473888.1 extracellular solute-binding protein [Lachnospiraceae bacterium]
MKRILAVLLVLAMVFSLAACSKEEDKPASNSGNTTNNSSNEGVVSDETATLKLWDIAVPGDGNRPAYDASLKELKVMFPNVTIEEDCTENEAYKPKIKAAVANNEVPDIFFTWAGAFLGDFANAGKVYCLDEELKKYVGNELPESMLGNSTYNGKHYGVPTTMNVVGLFANLDILAQVGYTKIPETKEELFDCCDKLVAKGIIPFGCSGKENWCVTEYLEPIIEKTIGATELNDIFRNGKTWNNAGIATAVDTLQQMIDKGYFDPNGIALGNEEVKANFMAGKYAFYQNGTWNCGDFSDPSKVSFNVTVGEWPVMDASKSSMGQLIGGPSDTIAVSANAPKVAAQFAVEFGRLICHYGYLAGSGLPAWTPYGDTSAVSQLVQTVAGICNKANGYVLFGDNAMSAEDADKYLNYVAKVYGKEIDGAGFVAGLTSELR